MIHIKVYHTMHHEVTVVDTFEKKKKKREADAK